MTEDTQFSMAYQDSLAGTPIIFIHGFPLNSQMWEPQFHGMSAITRLIAPDLRGFGLSDGDTPTYSMEVFADDIATLLDNLDIKQKVVLCGLSMGGYVALEFFRQHRERLAGLVLVATQAEADDNAARSKREKMIKKVEAGQMDVIAQALVPNLLGTNTAAVRPDIVQFLHDLIGEASEHGTVGALKAMKDRQSSADTLSQIQVPTLIIHGEQDQIIDVQSAVRMQAAIPNSQLVTLAESGHLPNLEQPNEFNQLLADFLDTL